ncbi:MAG: T9SS type A sorting domain-containing protein [Bacteroidia bacterium]|nr:T9SS type A sorting domain-containing protein [Bacteroidia bacterium]
MLFCFTDWGDTLWTRIYGDSLWQAGVQCKRDAAGNFFLFGRTETSDPDGDFWLIKADSTGAIIWEKTYGGARYEYGLSFDLTVDGGFIMVGTTKSFGSPNIGSGSNILVIKANASGTQQWQRAFGSYYGDAVWNVHMTRDAGYIICGSLSDTLISFPDEDLGLPYLIRLDYRGNTLWERTYGVPTYEGGLFAVEELSDGSFIAVGKVHTGTETGIVLKVDRDGDSLWMRHQRHLYGAESWNILRDISPAPDGGFIATGMMYPREPDSSGPGPWRQDLWVLKLDSLGCAYPGCELAATGIEEEESLSGLRVYPNPTSGSVTIEVEAPAAGRVLITDLTGKVIRQVDTPPGFSALEFGYPLAAGTYLCVFITDGTRHSSQLLIVQ